MADTAGQLLTSPSLRPQGQDSTPAKRNLLILPDGSIKEHGYAFTAPDADRIGMNMKWMLVNCSMTSRDHARPEM